jgi:hypothetical protein
VLILQCLVNQFYWSASKIQIKDVKTLTYSCDWLKALGLAFVLILVVSCQTAPPPPPVLSPSELALALREDPKILQDIKLQNKDLNLAFEALGKSGGWRERGYFSAQESDQLEHLLLKFYMNHRRLTEVIHHHQPVNDRDQTVPESSIVRSRKLHQNAQRLLVDQSRFLVNTFAGDPKAIAKINHSYPRSEIPRRTYDRLAASLKPNAYRQVSALSRKLGDGLDDSTYSFQAELITQVGKFKNPAAYLINFNESQKREVIAMLEPGDVILTYTAGYASTFFIPGAFKHSMVYVGSTEQRQAIGLTAAQVRISGGASVRRKIQAHLDVSKTNDGRAANVIEAVLEGVKFSNLEHIMDTHMNRLVVLRPRLSPEEREQYLVQVFSYLGQDYDFRFDFDDASRQVCTEVIYRSLNGLHGINFELCQHTGHLTLSSDDIINYWLNRHKEAFDFILYADEASFSPTHAARIRTGRDGLRHLEKVVNP